MSYMGLTKLKTLSGRTRLSTKGQVILPKAIRSVHDWRPGTEFEIEDRGDAVLLKAVRRRGTTRWEDLGAHANYRGPRLSIRDMDGAIEAEARRRRDRG